MKHAYEELVDFIAAGTTPEKTIAFHPSEASKSRAFDLIERKKSGGLSAEESSELEHYLQLEHLMRLAKARVQRFVS